MAVNVSLILKNDTVPTLKTKTFPALSILSF